MAGNSPVPAGVIGVGLKEQRLKAALSMPLTPEELWRQAVQSQRGFLSSSSGSADAYRNLPATLPRDLTSSGTRVGKGYETFAAIQVLDKDGLRLAVGADYFDGGAAENHGEARAIRGLEQNGPIMVPQGRLMVVVEKDPCPVCEQRLTEYASRRGITEIEIHVPQRASMVRPAQMVTPKQAAVTSFQDGRPTTTIRRLRTIKVPDGAHLLGFHESTSTSVRTAVIGTIANLGAGIALGILQKTFKAEILKSLENLPKPKLDRRAAGEYFSDPALGKAIRLIDLMDKNLNKLTSDIRDNHQKVIGETNLEIAVLAMSSLPVDRRLEFLTGLGDQLGIYGKDLQTLHGNVEAARQLEAHSLEAAKGAEDLAKTVDQTLVADFLLKQGFTFDEILIIYANLKRYAWSVRRVFQELATLQKETDTCIIEQSKLATSVNRVSWQIVLSRLRTDLNKGDAQ